MKSPYLCAGPKTHGLSLQETQKYTENDAEMEIDIGATCLQAKVCQGLPAATRSWRKAWPVSRPSEVSSPADTWVSDFWPPQP